MTVEAPELARWLTAGETDGSFEAGASEIRPLLDSGDRDSAATLKSVGAALDLLACFASDTELGVSDLGRRLGVAKSTAHRLLATLRSRGMVEHNPVTGQYRLGLRLLELGNLARDRHPMRQAILPHLVELRRVTGLPVRVGAPDGGDLLHVEHLSSSAAPAKLEELPWRLPLHHSAGGLALCATDRELAEDRLLLGLDRTGRFTDRAGFMAALDKVRADGVAVLHDSMVKGITTVAAPVLDVHGRGYMCVGVIAPTELVERNTDRLTDYVRITAGRMTRRVSPVMVDGGAPLLT